MKKNKFFCILILLLTIYFLFAGYAAFEDSMSISNVTSIVRLQENIRVSSFAYSSATSSATSVYEEYGLKSLFADINLPNSDSTVTYEVTVTNYGNTEMGIYEITGLPSNLTYSVTNYNLHDKVCDSSGECTLGASKTFYLTVSYTSDGYDSSNTEYSLNMEVDFRSFYTVTYQYITNNGYPTEVISGGNLVIDFGSSLTKTPTVYVNGQALSNSLYSYESGILTYNNVTGNVVVKPPSLSSIAVTTAPTKIMYNIGEQFNTGGMVVTATYSDGTTSTITNYTYSPMGELTENDTTITISYTENGQTTTTTQEIQVGYVITITGNGEDSATTNATVTINGTTYTSETKVVVAPGTNITLTHDFKSGYYGRINGVDVAGESVNYTVMGPISITLWAGDYDTNVPYSSYTSTYHVVTSVDFVTIPPDKTLYEDPDGYNSFSPTGMVVTHTYADGTKEIVTDYTYVSETGGETLTLNDTYIIVSYEREGNIYSTNVPIYVIDTDSGCFAEGTLITLADGTEKPIEEITYEDELLVWDFYNGTYAAAPPSLIETDIAREHRVLNLHFADGTTVRVIDHHGFFDVEENSFVFLDESNVESYIGHEFVQTAEDGKYNSVKLTGYTITVEEVRFYTILTAVHSNCIAEGMLTLTPEPIGLTGWYDTFEIDDGMKYDEENMQEMIDKYGLYEYEAFSDYITYEQFIAYNGPYLKIVVGKGYFTYEQIIEAIEYFYEIILAQQ